MAQIVHDRHPVGLIAAEATLKGWFGRPKALAVICVAVLAALGWIYLGWAVAHMGGAADAVGAGTLGRPALEAWSMLGRQTIDALCMPALSGALHDGGMAEAGAWGAGDVVVTFGMWAAMAFAMMLPSAGPMILTYAEIAETAMRKGERIVSPLVLAAGYLSIWLGFALVATLLQGSLTRVAPFDAAAAAPALAGAIFLTAGLYQFSAFKQACLTHCQRPFPFFFAHWSNLPRRVFRLGARQGLYCLGCCWALMLIMVAFGAMNLVWMALVGVVMMLEKLATTMVLSRIAGFVLGAIGLLLIGVTATEMWPM
jgi:predicted metal-binding membrane protein